MNRTMLALAAALMTTPALARPDGFEKLDHMNFDCESVGGDKAILSIRPETNLAYWQEHGVCLAALLRHQRVRPSGPHAR